MLRGETREIAKNMFGNQPYQAKARQALPILVRQAAHRQNIRYKPLADELGMPNARNLDFVLGSIGITLRQLSEKWEQKIPEIEALVVSQDTGEPGSGFFGGEEAYKKLKQWERKTLLAQLYDTIFNYPDWDRVLRELQLAESPKDYQRLFKEASNHQTGGESDSHRRLKLAISSDPTLVQLPRSSCCLGVEFPLPSGDSLDICFSRSAHRYAVEVKSALSDHADIVRGMFQCVKYEAVLKAMSACEQAGGQVRAILALEPKLPKELLPLKNALGVDVVDNIQLP